MRSLLIAVVISLTACSFQLYGKHDETVKVIRAFYGYNKGPALHRFAWHEEYSVDKNGLRFRRDGGLRDLNVGIWKISAFSDREKALFKVLTDAEAWKIRKIVNDNNDFGVGGVGAYYGAEFSNGRTISVASATDVHYDHPERIADPLRAYLDGIKLPDRLAAFKGMAPEKPFNMAVYFNSNSASLIALAKESLKKIANYYLFFRDRGSLTGVLLEGHTDQHGTRKNNYAQGRSETLAVKSCLVSLGVKASDIETRSFGDGRPRCVRDMGEA